MLLLYVFLYFLLCYGWRDQFFLWDIGLNLREPLAMGFRTKSLHIGVDTDYKFDRCVTIMKSIP